MATVNNNGDLKNGLSQEEAERRLAVFGLNVIPKAHQNLFRIYIAPLLNWLVNIYLVITLILAFFAFFVPNIWGQVAFWFAFIIVNAVVAIVQQAKAQKEFEALQRMAPGKSKVVRDGAVKEIPTEQVGIKCFVCREKSLKWKIGGGDSPQRRGDAEISAEKSLEG